MRKVLEITIGRPALRYVKKALGRRMVKRAVQKNLADGTPCRIIIGASGISQQGWVSTEEAESLDMLKMSDWRRYFKNDQIDALLAEHVWEHLTREQGFLAAELCFQFLKPGCYLRVAVPDGFHPDPRYIEQVKVGGLDDQKFALALGCEGAGHKVLYTHETLAQVFQSAGFRVDLLEYFDEQGIFHCKEWHPGEGMIFRSSRFDHRNKGGTLRYTSIILDAWKDAYES